MILDIIPAPYRWVGYLVIVLAIAGVGAYGGHWATKAYYAPKLANAESARDQYKSAYEHLGEKLKTQNDAVDELKKESEKRQQTAMAALKEADKYRAIAYKRAATLYALQMPKEECDALRLIIDTDRAHGM
jgi:hypothetical protein